MKEDSLYMDYAFIFSQSCGGAEEEEGGEEVGPSIHEQEMEKQKLLFQQTRLEHRGVAEMVLLYMSACRGAQTAKEKKDVGFFVSITGLMNSCSDLDLGAFERNQKAEGLWSRI